MDRDEFRSLLRDALLNIHDYVALEKHPLTEHLPRPEPGLRRAENVRRFVWNGIEALKPKTQRPQMDTLEWRYYLILSGRYIEGASVIELQKRLALGERQERRLHGRALSALEEILWEQISPDAPGGKNPQAASGPGTEAQGQEDTNSYPVSLEPINLAQVVHETAALFLPRLQLRGGDLSVQLPANLPNVQADRIILRQILLHLFNRILQSWAGEAVFIQARASASMVVLEILSLADPLIVQMEEELLSNELLAYWIERLSARISLEWYEEAEVSARAEADLPAQICYVLELPRANQATILVVDDHEPALRIIQRYLSHTNIQTVGVHEPAQVLAMTRTLHPQAVLLDVMMPAMDGWEILQKLKTDPETSEIPVIICSVWDQPELAFSLGANGFLKKPISQADLLNELARSNLLGTSGAPLPEGS